MHSKYQFVVLHIHILLISCHQSLLHMMCIISKDTASELLKCSSKSHILDNSHDMFDTLEDGEQRKMLTNFMTWASLTRDMEMQKGE